MRPRVVYYLPKYGKIDYTTAYMRAVPHRQKQAKETVFRISAAAYRNKKNDVL